MNKTNYKQYDTRWAKLPYPKKPYYIKDCGCGEVAICNAIIEMDKYKNETPKTIQPYCKQYAAPNGDGTYWSAIPKMMKYYGMTEVKEHATMDSLWKELAKGNRVAIYLMDNDLGGSRKIKWTGSKHFVTSVDYKYENGLHKVYMKDSNSDSSNKNEWISYEECFRNSVYTVWSGKLSGAPAPTPTPTPTPTVEHYPGAYPNPKKYLEKGDKGTEVTKLQKYIDWMFDGAFFKECGPADGNYGNNTLKWCKKMQKKLGFSDKECNGEVGPKTIAKMKAYGKPIPTPTPTPPTPTPPEPTPTPGTDYKVVDVSAFQSAIDWAKAKAAGIKGAIIRCGYRGYESGSLNEDKMFQNHIKGAHAAGVAVGVYFFTEAINGAEGRAEADYAISLVQKMGIPLSYPIAVDTEAQKAKTERAKNLSKAKRTEAIKGFCERCVERGYKPMIYASTSWLNNKLDMSQLPYDVWCAQYYDKCEYKGKYIMWQYTSTGKVNGISGDVDLNHCYVDPTPNPPTPTPKPEPEPVKKTYTGEYPNTTITKKEKVEQGSKITAKAKEYAWPLGTASDKYSYKEGSAKDSYKAALKKYMNKTAKISQTDCGYFSSTCVRASGVSSTFLCLPGSYKDAYPSVPSTMEIAHKGKISDLSVLKPGDVIRYRKSSGQHTVVYMGGGTIAHASRENAFPRMATSKPWTNSNVKTSTIQVLRAKPVEEEITRNYLKMGDNGEEAAKLQKYLIWYGALPADETTNGLWGPKTDAAVKQVQTDLFGEKEADGLVGPKTIEAMKKVER